jgi:hypothetical protein
MNLLANLSVLKCDLTEAQIRRLRELIPEAELPGGFMTNLLASDGAMTQSLGLLDDAGLRQWNGSRRKQAREYTLTYTRQYEAADLLACSYLEITPTGAGDVDGESPRTNSPDVVLYEAPMLDIGLVGMGRCYIVSAKVRKAMLSGGFSDLLWRQTKMKPSGIPPGERKSEYEKKIDPPKRGPWWALRSELVLPRLAPSMPLFHTDHTPFTGDFSKGCWRRDGLYTHAELRYRAADLEAFGPFDLAHTYEMFEALPREYDRPLVASQRFYQYCLKHKIETSWQQVRIEE